MPRSDIPFGAQFSPSQTDLAEVLVFIQQHRGNRAAIRDAIMSAFFTTQAEGQRAKLASNTILALQAYGLLERETANPTSLAGELLECAPKRAELHARFAKHILLDLGGSAFVETIQMMQQAGEVVTLHSLTRRLEQRRLHVPRGAVHLSSMRLWLAKAGIFSEGGNEPALYRPNQARLREVMGVGLDAIGQLADLSEAQRDFLRALATLQPTGKLPANEIADHATGLYATEFNHKELPKRVLNVLRDLGFIEVTKSTRGRGAKPFLVEATTKFRREIAEPVIAAALRHAALTPAELFRAPFAEILSGLHSANTHAKGKALELLTIRLSLLLDMEFKGWRLRGAETGGAEVDAVVESARLVFSRWQIQSKNTALVRLDDVAKEVGLSLTFLLSSVVVVVTTGKFTADSLAYADAVMRKTNLNVVLLDGSDLRQVADRQTQLVKILNEKAAHAMEIKARAVTLHPGR